MVKVRRLEVFLYISSRLLMEKFNVKDAIFLIGQDWSEIRFKIPDSSFKDLNKDLVQIIQATEDGLTEEGLQ